MESMGHPRQSVLNGVWLFYGVKVSHTFNVANVQTWDTHFHQLSALSDTYTAKTINNGTLNTLTCNTKQEKTTHLNTGGVAAKTLKLR